MRMVQKKKKKEKTKPCIKMKLKDVVFGAKKSLIPNCQIKNEYILVMPHN